MVYSLLLSGSPPRPPLVWPRCDLPHHAGALSRQLTRRRATDRTCTMTWLRWSSWLVCTALLWTAHAQLFSKKEECALRLPRLHVQKNPNFNKIEDSSADRYEDGDGEGLCITYRAVNEAFAEAREKQRLRSPVSHVTVNQLAALGTALQETTRILADRFRLTRDEIAHLLPTLNTTRTSIYSFCPWFLREDRHCEIGSYRRHDGACNNLDHPAWGAANVPFRRFLASDYGDGVSEPRVSRSGFPLPNPRRISSHVHRDEGSHDHAVTLMFVAWGQLIDHDLTFTAETKDPATLTDYDCCASIRRHPNCLPILLPPGDTFYGLHKQRCMNMLRSLAGVRDNCRLGPRVQINTISSYLDANFVYGSDMRVADSLRTLRGGRLRTLSVFNHLGLKELLPLKMEFPDEGCIRTNPDIYCFLAGDNRVNEQLILTVLHTVFVREHNRIVDELTHINPHWDDEKLYQETRRIIAALVQHITYTEFLPMLLGKETVHKFDLVPKLEGYAEDYDPSVDATVTSSFITAAFRFGHSLLPSVVERWSTSRKIIGAQRLSQLLRQPFDVYRPGWLDQYIMGLTSQLAQAMDDGVTQEVTNHLFQQPSHRYGMDLASINVQRAREHGVPSYNRYRAMCGLPPMKNWSSMLHTMTNLTVKRYNDVFDHPDDIDLWSAGVAEEPMPGSMVGPTFNCLIARTFQAVKRGDRFWYENSGWPSSFSPAQLQEIRKIRLSRLLCDNTDGLENIQVYAMVIKDYHINPIVSCRSKVLPRLDLNKWRDPPIYPSAQEIKLSVFVGSGKEVPTESKTEPKKEEAEVNSTLTTSTESEDTSTEETKEDNKKEAVSESRSFVRFPAEHFALTNGRSPRRQI